MTEQISISAKNLGELALPNFCPRCFWIKLKLKNKLPFQIFPGIFSTIDAYTKNVVHNWFDIHNCCPPWLSELGDITGYKKAPHYSKFFITDSEANIVLNGTPDDIFVFSDNSHAIVDYKTAKYTGTQDSLFPIYEIQLNAYALLGENNGFNPVNKLALIYMEPLALKDIEHENKHHRGDGFNMVFSAKILDVKHNIDLIKPLLKRTREIYDMSVVPVGISGCDNCQKLEALIGIC